jgi:hypothetical protein
VQALLCLLVTGSTIVTSCLLLWYLLSDRRNPVKTVEEWEDWTGKKVRRIKYNDTGKEVRQEKRRTWFGRREKKIYVEKRCHRCRRMVQPDQYACYYCPCGREFR